ncbi:LysR family transcriptional regulator substrate-binding protein [Saccharothrix yanglingensis]|uniref:LysR family transcriptional regulator substrate-binding protein n=1 Tax=Saccharothrix yanglingensis TaxID=659496 RepID=UPI0027D21DB7|nr:LysR family transcriptional regulator substrate-binding protein [Saccharothrix yanglingensis]
MGPDLIDLFRARHPGVAIRVVEGDLTDPTAGVVLGRVDVALTRGPFQASGVAIAEIRRDPVGVVVRTTGPPASLDRVHVDDVRDRRWFRLPGTADPLRRDYCPAAGAR